MINPELRRNIWLEINVGRLVFAVVVLGSLLMLLISFGHGNAAADMASWIYEMYMGLFLLVSGFWGIRRAAGAVPDELTEGTWDAQRLSAMSAWSMSWGKLLGATSYTWLIGLSCLAVALLSRLMEGAGGPGTDSPDLMTALAEHIALVLVVIMGQAIAMATSLVMRRWNRQQHSPPRVTLAHLVGLQTTMAVALGFHGEGGVFLLFEEEVSWWIWQVDIFLMDIIIATVAAGFALIGVERCMRVELRQPYLPWAWTLSAVAAFLIIGGYPIENAPLAALINIAMGIAVFMMYLSLFVDMPDLVRYRIMCAHYVKGRYAQAAALLPLWAQSITMLALVCLYIVIVRPSGLTGIDGLGGVEMWWKEEWNTATLPAGRIVYLAITLFLFACRDVILLHLIRVLGSPTRVLFPFSIVLLMAYVVLPGIFHPKAFDIPWALALLWPAQAAVYDYGFLIPLTEGLLLGYWWRARAFQPAPDQSHSEVGSSG